jgi:alkylation response protein AidB-like acyl-CoA dehydrogenase
MPPVFPSAAMNLSLTEDQRLIREVAARVLAEASTSAAVRRAMESASGHDEALWRRIAGELGWCALALSEAHGGLGLGAVESVLLFEQMGRHLLCAPYFSTVALAANVLEQIGSEAACADYLAPIARGALRATTVPEQGALAARREGTAWRLDGRLDEVLDGATAQVVFALARLEGTPALFAVPADATGLRRRPLAGWDLTRRYAALEFQGVRLDAAARVDDPGRVDEGLRRARACARLFLAAEQLGGAQACLEQTVAYTMNRKQFGRAIASFQAVKHRCAQMMVRIEATRSMVYGAAALAARAPKLASQERECAAAKALACETYFWCAGEAIQLHGGVGFTWDYDPQLHFKRAQAGWHWLGAPAALRAAIAAQVLENAA